MSLTVDLTKITTSYDNLSLAGDVTHTVISGGGNGITVKGDFNTVNSSTSNRAILRATVSGQAGELNLQGIAMLADQVNVKDSDASLGITVIALGSIDSGNNTNWDFGAQPESEQSEQNDDIGSLLVNIIL